MKTKCYLLATVSLMLALASCKKDNTQTQNNQIVGKWYVNKLTVEKQTMGTSPTAITDTTYLSNNFTVNDYLRFNTDSVSALSGYGTFFRGYTIEKTAAENEIPFSYSVKGTTLTLKSLWIPNCIASSAGCSIPVFTETILKLDAHNLVIQDIVQDNASTYKITTDTYYTK